MLNRPYDEDPEVGDENDPEYKEELFRTLKFMGWKPETLQDPKDRKEYTDWLERHASDGD